MNLWGVGHIVVGTDHPCDMGGYDPRGFADGREFPTDADKARVLDGNAARLLGRRSAPLHEARGRCRRASGEAGGAEGPRAPMKRRRGR